MKLSVLFVPMLSKASDVILPTCGPCSGDTVLTWANVNYWLGEITKWIFF